MNRKELIAQIRAKKSFLCVGLDPDLDKIPQHLLAEEDPILSFNKAIIDATAPYAVAFKPNLAFYEAQGERGLHAFAATVDYLHSHYPEQFIIADAKRGDIGNTSRMYAKTFFEEYDVDALTVAPYMGEDSVTPFLEYEGKSRANEGYSGGRGVDCQVQPRQDKVKWVVLLALTSNKGAADFQLTADSQGERLFEKVIRRSQQWGDEENMMYVVGATQGSLFSDIRRIVPHHFLLVPGVGAQGGSLEEVCKYGMNADCGLLVNSSRGIIYASGASDFAERAAQEARKLQEQMARQLPM